MYVVVGLVICFIIFYFIIDYKIKNYVKSELIRIDKKKSKHIKNNTIKQRMMLPQPDIIGDADSYVDPIASNDENENPEAIEEPVELPSKNNRLKRESIGMRDLEDGMR